MGRDVTGSYVQRELVAGGLSGSLANNEAAPRLMALVDDLGRITLVLCLSGESERILRLSIRYPTRKYALVP